MLGPLLKKVRRMFRRPPEHPYFDRVHHGDFLAAYDDALVLTGTKQSVWRRDRFYNLHSLIRYTKGIPGSVADCGVYKGLSSLVILKALEGESDFVRGRGFYAIDSFEGLSRPSAEDGVPREYEGILRSGYEEVRRNLTMYPEAFLAKGWIPDVLSKLPETSWRFVHIDVDLIDPTLAAMEYFYPRLAPGGVILCDDYASKVFPNLKAAVDEFLAPRGWRALPLSTCQLLIKK